MVGAFLIAAAAVVVFTAALSGSSGAHPVVVAARALPAGTIIGPGDTATESLKLPSGTRSVVFSQPAVVVGRALAVGTEPGEIIEPSMLTPAGGPALRPVSVAVDPDSLAGLATGESVDVLATPSASSGSPGGAPALTVVVRGAALFAVDRGGSGLLPTSSSAAVATLGVGDLAEAEAIVEAAHSGTITLVQAEPSDGEGLGPGGAAGAGQGG